MFFLYEACERTSIKPLIFLIHILRVNVYDITVTNIITTLCILSILSFFVTIRVNLASAADTVDSGSITGLVNQNLIKFVFTSSFSSRH